MPKTKIQEALARNPFHYFVLGKFNLKSSSKVFSEKMIKSHISVTWPEVLSVYEKFFSKKEFEKILRLLSEEEIEEYLIPSYYLAFLNKITSQPTFIGFKQYIDSHFQNNVYSKLEEVTRGQNEIKTLFKKFIETSGGKLENFEVNTPNSFEIRKKMRPESSMSIKGKINRIENTHIRLLELKIRIMETKFWDLFEFVIPKSDESFILKYLILQTDQLKSYKEVIYGWKDKWENIIDDVDYWNHFENEVSVLRTRLAQMKRLLSDSDHPHIDTIRGYIFSIDSELVILQRKSMRISRVVTHGEKIEDLSFSIDIVQLTIDKLLRVLLDITIEAYSAYLN